MRHLGGYKTLFLSGVIVILLAACVGTERTTTPTSGAALASASPTVPSQSARRSSASPTSAAGSGRPAEPAGNSRVIGGNGDTNVEQAFARFSERDQAYLIMVSDASTGLEGQIYQDLQRRHFRMTAGGDEGFDTRSESCHPNCLYVLSDAANALSAEEWLPVLEHEYRHVVQARNNPTLAADFKQDGQFTTYAAFSEACADYGLNVAPVYDAQARIDQVKQVLGPNSQSLLDRACQGDKGAYQGLLDQFNRAAGASAAFSSLFPPYD